MSERISRRGFLLGALASVGSLLLATGGLAGRAARRAAVPFRIPFRRLDRMKLREPHDLAG